MEQKNQGQVTTDQILIRKANCHKNDVTELNSYGVKKEYLNKKAQQAWDFIEEYKEDNNGETPPDEILVLEIWDGNAIPFQEIEGSIKYFSDIIVKRALTNRIEYIVDDIESQVKKGPEYIEETREKLLRYAEEVREMGIIESQVTNLFDHYPQVIENYESYEKGELGIDTPWPTITQATLGWQFGSVNWIVARPGIGKTFTLLKTLLNCHRQGYRILMVSPELMEDELAERSACIQCNISYEQFIEGNLGFNAKENLEKQVNEFKDEKRFWILCEVMESSKRQVESAIDQFDPDIIAIDSAYLIGEGRNRNEKVADVSPWLEEIANTFDRERVVFATGQMNRRARSPETTTMDNIYGSDAVGQDADVIYALFANKNMKLDNMIGCKPLKIRRGSEHEPFYMNFDMISMDFSEVEDNAYNEEDEDEEFDIDF